MKEVDELVEEMAKLADELSESLNHPRYNSRLYDIQRRFDSAMGRKMAKTGREQ